MNSRGVSVAMHGLFDKIIPGKFFEGFRGIFFDEDFLKKSMKELKVILSFWMKVKRVSDNS